MNIAVDMRSLQTGSVSGVENYVLQALKTLIPIDHENKYTLFYNAVRPQKLPELQFINAETIYLRIPNKILNLSLKFFKYPKFEQLLGGFDCLFLPNLNQFAIVRGTRLAVTVHDLSPYIMPETYNWKRRLWHFLLGYRTALNAASIIFAVSEFTKRDIIDMFGISEEKIQVVYPGIDHLRFYPDLPQNYLRDIRNRLGLPGDYILFLSTLEPRKNLSQLIRAFNSLPDKVDLVIAGKLGWKYAQSIREITNSPKRKSIHYLGPITEHDKPGVMKLARVVAYPSLYEGFGFVPLEAMAVGTPVLTSQVSAIPEVVGDAALLVNPYTEDDLAEGLHILLTQESFRNTLIHRGLLHTQKYTWARTAQGLLDGFNSLKNIPV